MRIRRRIAVVAAGSLGSLFLLVLMVWPSPPPPDPVYEGRPLSAWLEGLVTRTADRSLEASATNALNEVGTNAIPTLLRLLQTRDSPLKARLFALVEKQHFIKVKHVDSQTLNLEAVRGLQILGPRAAPAVPELVRIYDRDVSPLSKDYITSILSYIGPGARAAIPSLLRETGNANEDVRGPAYGTLAYIHTDSEEVVPVIIKGLQDPSFLVRATAARGLGYLGPDAKSAVPVLVDCIKKINLTPPPPLPSGARQPPASYVRRAAIEALKKIDPEAAAKLATELNESW